MNIATFQLSLDAALCPECGLPAERLPHNDTKAYGEVSALAYWCRGYQRCGLIYLVPVQEAHRRLSQGRLPLDKDTIA